MKYLYIIIFTTTLVVLQWLGAVPMEAVTKAPHVRVQPASYRAQARKVIVLRPAERGPEDKEVFDRLNGLEYSKTTNTWILYGTVLQLKNTSIYGRPGEIARIAYSLDAESSRFAWIVVKIDDYSFGDVAVEAINIGQKIVLYVSGAYVSSHGVDWEKCPNMDVYCMNAGFVEGGFPQSEDYDGLTLCPSNTMIRSGYAPDDWINGMLAWKIRIIPNS
jgi:hypothetical protein